MAEVVLAGFLAHVPDFDGVLCLPGTHTKWVHISAGEIVSFSSFMTGELFALLSKRSVLRHSVAGGGWDAESFVEAVLEAMAAPAELEGLRRTSLRLMRRLSAFSPKLVGPVLSGLADQESVIGLHLRADPPEAVQWFLMERRIRFEMAETRIPLAGGRWERLPTYRLSFDGAAVDLVVFDARQWRQTPLAGVDGRPLARAGLTDVEALVDDAAADDRSRGVDARG